MSDYSDEMYAGSQKRNFMGHPIGLSVLFFTRWHLEKGGTTMANMSDPIS